MEELNVSDFFHDFFYYKTLSNINLLQLKKECINISNEVPSTYLSNRGGYQSPILFKDNIDSSYKELHLFLETIEDVKEELTAKFHYKDLDIGGFWININKKYNYNTTHNHPGTVFGGVYYIDVPEDSNSNLNFIRDFRFSDYMEGICKQEADMKRHTTRWTVAPYPGYLIIFPGYLLHSVDMNQSSKERISIAFHFDLKK